jgi:hypothetical protein
MDKREVQFFMCLKEECKNFYAQKEISPYYNIALSLSRLINPNREITTYTVVFLSQRNSHT